MGGFRSQLEASCVSSNTELLWYNGSVSMWLTIYICIYIYIFECVCACVCAKNVSARECVCVYLCVCACVSACVCMRVCVCYSCILDFKYGHWMISFCNIKQWVHLKLRIGKIVGMLGLIEARGFITVYFLKDGSLIYINQTKNKWTW